MVEQRWRELGRGESHPGPYAVIPGQHPGQSRYFVLQYRTAPETFETYDGEIYRSGDPVWSDWRDVPTAIQQNPSVLDNSACTSVDPELSSGGAK